MMDLVQSGIEIENPIPVALGDGLGSKNSSNVRATCQRNPDPPPEVKTSKELSLREKCFDIQQHLNWRKYVVEDKPEDVEQFVSNFLERAREIEEEEKEKMKAKRRRFDCPDTVLPSGSKISKSNSSLAMMHHNKSDLHKTSRRRGKRQLGQLPSKTEDFVQILRSGDRADWLDDAIMEARTTRLSRNRNRSPTSAIFKFFQSKSLM